MRRLAAMMVILLVTPALADGAWVEFRDPLDAFTVEFPGHPTAKNEIVVDNGGNKVPSTKYTVDTAHTELMVSDDDFGAFKLPVDKALDNAIAGLGRTVVTDIVITRDGHDGRMVTGRLASGIGYTSMLFLVDKHLYQVVAVAEKDPAPQDAADNLRFAQTFHFLSK